MEGREVGCREGHYGLEQPLTYSRWWDFLSLESGLDDEKGAWESTVAAMVISDEAATGTTAKKSKGLSSEGEGDGRERETGPALWTPRPKREGPARQT